MYSVDGIVGGNEGTDMGIMRKIWIFVAFVGMMSSLACGGQGIENGTPTQTAAIAPSPTASTSTPTPEPTAAPTPTIAVSAPTPEPTAALAPRIAVSTPTAEPTPTIAVSSPTPELTPAPTIAISTPIREPTAAPTPTAEPSATPIKLPVISETTLPELSLEYKDEIFGGYIFEGCWREDSESDVIGCWVTAPHIFSYYIEIERGDTVTVQITPDIRPTKLLASIFTEPGNVPVGGLIRLSPDDREFVMDTTPGKYRAHFQAQWFEGKADFQHKVSYEFGLEIPGEVELMYGCGSTLEGGDLDIVLDSLEDRYRTAVDAVNGGWCQFNKEIAQVRLILESDATDPYVEIFQVDPPSEYFSLPLPDEFDSESTGGPLPPGEYSRRMVAVAVDGSEKELDIGHTDLIMLGEEMSDSGFPIMNSTGGYDGCFPTLVQWIFYGLSRSRAAEGAGDVFA